MRCDDFWTTEAPASLCDPEGSASFHDHINRCDKCRRQTAEIRQGLIALQDDIQAEEPAAFWRDMRLEISREVGTPTRMTHLLRAWVTPAKQWCGALAMASLVLMAIFLKPGPAPQTLIEEEIPLLVGTPRAFMAYDPIAWDMQTSADAYDETSIYQSMDDWNGLMVDLMENAI